MKQQDKNLLIKDLCARLPYETTIEIDGMYNTHLDFNVIITFLNGGVENIKPYLFPLSSMTWEQKCGLYLICNDINIIGDKIVANENADITKLVTAFDWINEHHFDYRGLIDKGLAIDCANLNIY